jgi:hypothetical protein
LSPIYNNLKKSDEVRLFIDINTKQRPVPNELLLDIKRLAETETEVESLSRDVFDLFSDKEDMEYYTAVFSTLFTDNGESQARLFKPRHQSLGLTPSFTAWIYERDRGNIAWLRILALLWPDVIWRGSA